MKLFDQLVFEPHPADLTGTHAVIEFDNGYSASVITGRLFYTSPDRPYELAVLKGGWLCYTTPVTDDVIGHLTEKEVEENLQAIKALPKAGD